MNYSGCDRSQLWIIFNDSQSADINFRNPPGESWSMSSSPSNPPNDRAWRQLVLLVLKVWVGCLSDCPVGYHLSYTLLLVPFDGPDWCSVSPTHSKNQKPTYLETLKFLQNVEKDVTERDNVIVGNVMRQWDQDRTPHLLLFCCIIRHVSTQDRGDWCLVWRIEW